MTEHRSTRLSALSAAAALAVTAGGLALAAPAQAAAYDLVVTDVRPTVAGVQATGSEVRFQATIANVGTAPTPAGVVHGVAFSVGGRTVSWSDSSSDALAPGATRTLEASWGPAGKATWTAADGTSAVRAWVDDVNRIGGEAREDNNTRTANVTAAAVKPVTGLRVVPALDQAAYERSHQDPASPTGDSTLTATWKVPAGQPVGVTYTVEEHALTPSGGCHGLVADAGTTTGGSLTFVATAGVNCFGHGNALDADYVVIARGPGGRPAAASAVSAPCHALYSYGAYSHGQQNWSLSCESGGPSLYDFVDPVSGLIDVGATVRQGPWEKDQGFTGGQAYTAVFPGLTPEQTTSRWGWSRYSVPIDSGWFRNPCCGGDGGTVPVRLTFVEPTFTRPGQRVFDVRVNGQLVAAKLDIFAKVGRGKPYVVEARVPLNAADPDVVEVVPTSYADHPIVATIEAYWS